MEDKEVQIRRIMLSLNRIDEIYYRWGRKVGIKENLLAPQQGEADMPDGGGAAAQRRGAADAEAGGGEGV